MDSEQEATPEILEGLGGCVLGPRRGHGQARALLQTLRPDHTRATGPPESHDWESVAGYRQTRDKDDLWAMWRELVAPYPGLAWARRTAWLDPVPAP